jgi:hypothetical protein
MLHSIEVRVQGHLILLVQARGTNPSDSYIPTDEIGRMIYVMRTLGHDNVEVIARDMYCKQLALDWEVSGKDFYFTVVRPTSSKKGV